MSTIRLIAENGNSIRCLYGLCDALPVDVGGPGLLALAALLRRLQI